MTIGKDTRRYSLFLKSQKDAEKSVSSTVCIFPGFPLSVLCFGVAIIKHEYGMTNNHRWFFRMVVTDVDRFSWPSGVSSFQPWEIPFFSAFSVSFPSHIWSSTASGLCVAQWQDFGKRSARLPRRLCCLAGFRYGKKYGKVWKYVDKYRKHMGKDGEVWETYGKHIKRLGNIWKFSHGELEAHLWWT